MPETVQLEGLKSRAALETGKLWELNQYHHENMRPLEPRSEPETRDQRREASSDVSGR